MERVTSQKISWYQKLAKTTSRAVRSAHSGGSTAVSKMIDVWTHTPKAVKFPLELAILLHPSYEWIGLKGAASLAALAEIPKDLFAFLRNQPVKCFGQRWQLLSSFFPADPRAPLTDLDQKIGTFERAQPSFLIPTPPTATVKSSIDSFPPPNTSVSSVNNMEKFTNARLTVLIQKVSYLSILKTMHICSGALENDSTNILSLVDEASRTAKPSLWNIFISHYGHKISWWGCLKAGLLYLVLWHWIPIIPKTIDAYLKNILTELRINLKENGEKRKQFINGILEDTDNFLDVYNGAVEKYASDLERKGNIEYYQKTAIDRMLPKEEFLGHTHTPEALRMDLYRKLSASMMDHFAPRVPFRWFEGLLNCLIQRTLRNHILPEVFLNISDEGKAATKQHNIPFFLALTNTLTEQISKLQERLDHDAFDSSSLTGIKNFESIVKKFLWSIDMAGCKTVDEVRCRLEQLKRLETGIDADVRNGIQLGIQKGLAVFCNYLSDQKHAEDLFASLFESLTRPLSGHFPLSNKQWAEMSDEYAAAKIVCEQRGFALSKQLVQEAVEEKVRGGSKPAATEKVAQKIFSEHRMRGQEAFEQLLRRCNSVREKIKQLKDPLVANAINIHPELGAMASTLKAFENKERVKITLEQDPPPQIALLPPAEREAILRVLYPVYEGSNQIIDLILELQTLQEELSCSIKLEGKLSEIKKGVETIVWNEPFANALAQIEPIKNYLDPRSPITVQLHALHKTLEQLVQEQKALNALSTLSLLLDPLTLYAQGRLVLGFKKWKCLEQIKENVKIAFPVAKQLPIFQLIELINRYNTLSEPRPDFEEISKPLSLMLGEQQIICKERYQQNLSLLKKEMPRFRQCLQGQETTWHYRSEKIWEAMNGKAAKLETDVSKLYQLIEHAQKEVLLHPSAAQLGQIGGILGFVLGALVERPVVGGAIGGIFVSGIAGLQNIPKKKWLKFAIPLLGASTLTALAARALAQYMPAAGICPDYMVSWLPALISAALASLGMEYAGAKITNRVIDTGVEIAMPKVIQTFNTAYNKLVNDSDIFINGGRILIKEFVALFPPKR